MPRKASKTHKITVTITASQAALLLNILDDTLDSSRDWAKVAKGQERICVLRQIEQLEGVTAAIATAAQARS